MEVSSSAIKYSDSRYAKSRFNIPDRIRDYQEKSVQDAP